MPISGSKISGSVGLASVSKILGGVGTDAATCCTANSINMWSRWKPVKVNQVSELTAQQFRDRSYGLKQPTGLSGQTVNDTDKKPYFTYDKLTYPTGSDGPYDYRLTDFVVPLIDHGSEATSATTRSNYPGYNRDATCMVHSTLEWNQSASVDGGTDIAEIKIDRDDPEFAFISHDTDPNVEIEISDLPSRWSLNSPFGIFFWVSESNSRFYYKFPYTLSQILSGYSGSTPIYNWNIRMDATELLATASIALRDQDTVHMYYCTTADPPAPPDTIQYYLTADLNQIQIIAPAENNGHGVIHIKRFNIGRLADCYNMDPDGVVTLGGRQPAVLGTVGTQTVNSFSHWLYAPCLAHTSVQPVVYEKLVITGNVIDQEHIFYSSKVINSPVVQPADISIGSWQITHTNLNVPIDQQQLIHEDNPEVYVEVYNSLDNSSWELRAEGTFNLRGSMWKEYYGYISGGQSVLYLDGGHLPVSASVPLLQTDDEASTTTLSRGEEGRVWLPVNLSCRNVNSFSNMTGTEEWGELVWQVGDSSLISIIGEDQFGRTVVKANSDRTGTTTLTGTYTNYSQSASGTINITVI